MDTGLVGKGTVTTATGEKVIRPSAVISTSAVQINARDRVHEGNVDPDRLRD